MRVRAHVTGSILDYGADGEKGTGDDVTYSIDQWSSWLQADLTVYQIQVNVQRKGSGDPWSSDASIAAGGKDSDVHKANVQILFTPGLDADTEVQVSLSDGGEGYEPSSWWWSKSRTRSQLTLTSGGTGTYVAGETTSPLILTPAGSLVGILTSSNKLESTQINVNIPDFAVSRSAAVQFVLGDFTVDLGQAPFPINTWRSFDVSSTLSGSGVDNHDLNFVVTKVVLETGEVLEPDLGSGESSSDSLVEYVELDGPYWTHKAEKDTTDGNGDASGQFQIVDSSVVSLEITAFDMDVAE